MQIEGLSESYEEKTHKHHQEVYKLADETNGQERMITFKDLSKPLKAAIIILWIMFGLTLISWGLYVLIILASTHGGVGMSGGNMIRMNL
jgi:hypothetical protein